MAKLNLFKTVNGDYFVSFDRELTESSLIRVKNLAGGWGDQILINPLWSKSFFLTSYGSLKEVNGFIAAFNS